MPFQLQTEHQKCPAKLYNWHWSSIQE